MRSRPHPARARAGPSLPLCARRSPTRGRSRAPVWSRAPPSREGASRRPAHAAPLPRGAGSRGPRSRPPLAWPGPEAAPHGLGLARGAGTGARSDMGKKHKKHKSDKHLYEGEELGPGGDGEPTATLWAFRAFDTTLERPRRACGRTFHEQARTRGGGAARPRRPRLPRVGAALEPGTPGRGWVSRREM